MGDQAISIVSQDLPSHFEQKPHEFSDPSSGILRHSSSGKQKEKINTKPANLFDLHQPSENDNLHNSRSNNNHNNNNISHHLKPLFVDQSQKLNGFDPQSFNGTHIHRNEQPSIQLEQYFDPSSIIDTPPADNNQKAFKVPQHQQLPLAFERQALASSHELYDQEMKQFHHIQLAEGNFAKNQAMQKPFQIKSRSVNIEYPGYIHSTENDNSIGGLCATNDNFGQASHCFVSKRGALFTVEDSNNIMHQNFHFDFTQQDPNKPPSYNSNTLPRQLHQQNFASQNRFRNNDEEVRLKFETEQCPFNQLQQEIVNQTYAMPPVAYSEEEPRYVNAAQFKRMMIMRIKRAARDLKMNKAAETIRPPTNTEGPDSSSKLKKYKYESRHKHATNRIRDSKGRFIPKDKLQEYFEQLEREKREKESSFDIESSTQKTEFLMKPGNSTAASHEPVSQSSTSASPPQPTESLQLHHQMLLSHEGINSDSHSYTFPAPQQEDLPIR